MIRWPTNFDRQVRTGSTSAKLPLQGALNRTPRDQGKRELNLEPRLKDAYNGISGASYIGVFDIRQQVLR